MPVWNDGIFTRDHARSFPVRVSNTESLLTSHDRAYILLPRQRDNEPRPSNRPTMPQVQRAQPNVADDMSDANPAGAAAAAPREQAEQFAPAAAVPAVPIPVPEAPAEGEAPVAVIEDRVGDAGAVPGSPMDEQ